MNKAFNKIIKSQVKLTILSVIAVILITIGTTYALFSTTHRNTTNQTISIGEINASLTGGASIVLSDIYPIEESEIANNIPTYTFTLSNPNGVNNYAVNYELFLADDTSTIINTSPYNNYTQITSDYYDYIMYKLDDNESASLGSIYNSTSSKFILKEDYMGLGASENHTLKFWISNTAPNSLAGKVLSLKVGMTAIATKPSLVNYIISQYGTDANLYYHTTDTTKYQNGEGSITSTDPSSSTLETYANLNAGDGSYRYSGASASVHNYVCFGTSSESECLSDTSNNGTSKYLYRIIGVFDDGSGNKVTKIILANPLYNSATSASTYRWDTSNGIGSNDWANASLKQWLNNETLKSGSESYYPTTKFLSNYTNTWINKIAPSTWYVRGFTSETLNAKSLYTDEIANVKNGVSGYTTNYQGNSAILTNTKVGLEYISDYMYAANPIYWNYPGYSSSGETYDYRAARTYDWLFNSLNTWSVSPHSGRTYSAWYVDSSGPHSYFTPNTPYAVCPVFYLASTTQIDTSATSADGSASHPYILKA